MEHNQSERSSLNTSVHDDKIVVWPVVRLSFSVLFRHVVPFVVLVSIVGWTVGIVLFLTGLAPFLVLGNLVLRNPDFATLYYRQIASITLRAASRVAAEAVIAMAVWRDLSGRRLTLKDSLITVARAIPGILHRPFYLFVSRVSAVAILRALLYLPHQAAAVLVVTSELEMGPKGALLALSVAGIVFNVLVDSRLLVLLPIAAIERRGVLDSFKRCWQLTSRHWTRILGVLLLVGCFAGALEYASNTLLKGVAGYLREHDLAALLAVAILLVKGLVRACWAVVATVSYRHIRVANGEIAPEQAGVPPAA